MQPPDSNRDGAVNTLPDGWRRQVALWLLITSIPALVVGLFVPVLTVDSLFLDQEQSIAGAVSKLLLGGEYLLGIVIGFFSILFPLTKAIVLGDALLHRRQHGAVKPLLWATKWSMLDVFIVVVSAGLLQLGILGEARASDGIYWFLTAVLMAGVAGTLFPLTGSHRMPTPWLAGIAVALFVGGLLLPLMTIEKWLIWDQEFTLLRALLMMQENGKLFLPAMLMATVVVIPGLEMFLALDRRHRLDRFLPRLAKWSMLDLFVIGMFLVWFKVRDDAEVTLHIGFWLLMGAAALFTLATRVGEQVRITEEPAP